MPEKIQNAPRILPGLQLYLSAFFDLDRERDIGFSGKEVIKQRDVMAYAAAHGFDDDQTLLLSAVIPKMDSAFLKRLEAKRPKPPPDVKQRRKR